MRRNLTHEQARADRDSPTSATFGFPRAAAARSPLPGRAAALVVAHPGHELRVHGWLEHARPHVFILTDGSGHSGRSRIGHSTEVLEGAGAVAGTVYGAVSDRALYAAILEQDFPLFEQLADELAEAFVRTRVDHVVGDARDGYNPGHDICRMLIQTALVMVKRSTGSELSDFDFPLIGPPGSWPDGHAQQATALRLDDDMLQRKLDAALRYEPLREEIAPRLRELGPEAFRSDRSPFGSSKTWRAAANCSGRTQRSMSE